MTIEIPAEVLHRAVGSLIHFLWQGAGLAAAAALSLRALKGSSARVRYATAAGFMLAMASAPPITFIFYRETASVIRVVLERLGRSSAQGLDTTLWVQWIAAGWLMGVAVCSVRLVAGWAMTRRMVKRAAPVEQALLRLFEPIRARLVPWREVQLRVGFQSVSPSVVGWVRLVILLPVSAVTGLTEEQLIAVLAHELAHVRRYDFLMNMVQRAVESVLFYHPAVWWISSRVRTEREHCADHLAVEFCGDRQVLAEALMRLEEARALPALAPVGATDGDMVERIARILGRDQGKYDWPSIAMTALFVLTLIGMSVWQSLTVHSQPLQSAFLPPAPPVLSMVQPAMVLPAVDELGVALAAIATAEQPAPFEHLPLAPLAPVNAGTEATESRPSVETWPGFRGQRPLIEAFVEESDLIGQAVVMSVSTVRETTRQAPFSTRVFREAEVTMRLSEVYKGKEFVGAEVVTIMRLDMMRKDVAPGQQYLVFLTGDLSGLLAPLDPLPLPPHYLVRNITWGFDSGASGVLEIVSGKTTYAINVPRYEDMQDYLGKEVAVIASAIRRVVGDKSGRPVMQALVEDSDLVAEGVVTAAGRLYDAGTPRERLDVIVRVGEVYKGKALKDTDVAVATNSMGQPVKSGERLLMFLKSAGEIPAGLAGDPSRSLSLPRYKVSTYFGGIDGVETGLLEIVSGKTGRAVSGTSHTEMSKYFGTDVDRVIGEIRTLVPEERK